MARSKTTIFPIRLNESLMERLRKCKTDTQIPISVLLREALKKGLQKIGY